MMIESLRLHRFRNYDEEIIRFPQSIIVLYGRNGQGKTNLLEALYMAGVGKSYRGMADNDLINWDKDDASLIVSFDRSGVQQQIKIILSKIGRKELWVNETKVSQKELFGTLHEVLFSPEDLQLIKGSPALRRRFMDMEISQVSPAYYRTLMQYNRAISQRNMALKEMHYGRKQSLLEWDRQIAGFSSFIVQKRLDALRKIGFLAGVLHRRLTGGEEKLTLSYHRSYGLEKLTQPEDQMQAEWYFQCLQEHLEQDIYRMNTSVGPHRDDLSININEADARKYGSQGQQRTAVLSLKLSELEFIKSETGEYPVLLLDDVMSELDEQRRCSLLDFVRRRIQTFITTTDPDMFRTMDGCSFIRIEKGKVQAHE
jgi:DNA replication and repair protein RecF